ncbi:MAG: hypothetical protein ACOCSN_04615 [Halanaeroarchaeum sp.]
MASAAPMTEPHVLARTKRRLFPESDVEGTYAVVDTQFSTDTWLDGDDRISSEVHEVLAPFNHVRMGSGYPDLVGVRSLDSDLLAVDRVGDGRALVAVEAKGRTADGTVDVERGIVQAYDRLHEANVAFVAAPAAAVSPSARTLARELNVGVLGVAADGDVRPLQAPRFVGPPPTPESNAIAFQASAQGVAEKSFGLNHPKNYLAYPLAVYHPGETAGVLSEFVVGATDDARRGAAFLNLIDERPDGVRLTSLGREVVRFALDREGSVDAALEKFEDWKRSRQRFSDLAPEWGLLTRRIVHAYPATELLVEELQHLHEDGRSEPSLVDLVAYLHELRPSFAVELFVRGTDAARRRVLTPDGELRREALADGAVYHAPTTFQLKAMLYHAGILTERGREPHRLEPTTDVWALRQPV